MDKTDINWYTHDIDSMILWKEINKWLISFTINGNFRIHVSGTSSINILYLILFIIIISSSSKWCLSCLKRNISNRR